MIHQLTSTAIHAAARHVHRELEALGIYCERLRSVRTERSSVPPFSAPTAVGFFVHQDGVMSRMIGQSAGNIYIVRWRLSSSHSIRDVIRHEFAHALQYFYPKYFESYEFDNTFKSGTHCVTDYATTSPEEDFAETFMLYLKHNGKFPDDFSKKDIARKWDFVRRMVKTLRSKLSRRSLGLLLL